MKKDHNYVLTKDVLQQYSEAAVLNAGELVAEASLLKEHGHLARAYFLAVAAIEEMGKAVQAFDAQGRNLTNSAVTARIKERFNDHSSKITTAFVPWMIALPMNETIQQSLELLVEMSISLKDGREPSMYTDIRPGTGEIAIPSKRIRHIAGVDCVRLAIDCLKYVEVHIKGAPRKTSREEDEFFLMKSSQIEKVTSDNRFGAFLLSLEKTLMLNMTYAIPTFYKKYLSKGKFNYNNPRTVNSDAVIEQMDQGRT